MDDIVERLREHIAVVIDNKGHVFEDEHLCDIAADRIEALEARIAKADALAEVAKRAVKLSQQDDTFKLYAMEPIWQALADYRDGTDTLVAAVLDKVVQDRDEALNQLDSEKYSVEVLKRRVQKVREKALREAADVAIDYGKQQYIANVVNQPRYADDIADDAQEIAGEILALIGKKNSRQLRL
jgi:hypothetical protein